MREFHGDYAMPFEQNFHSRTKIRAGSGPARERHGVITMEFPHLQRLMEENQFDTIYHEHFSYFSFLTAEKIFAAHGLTLFDVEELTTHGGSLRIFARHVDDSSHAVTPRVQELRAREEKLGYAHMETYSRFADQVKETKRKLLEFLIEAKRSGKKICRIRCAWQGPTPCELLLHPH